MREQSRLEAEIDAELDEVGSSVDPVGADEPVRAPYETRLHSLHDAVVQVERPDQASDYSGL